MIVEEMNILTTVFLRYDNQKIIIPNSVLATKAIHNYYRSPDMLEIVEFCIHVKTPAEKIGLMKQRIMRLVEKKIFVVKTYCILPLRDHLVSTLSSRAYCPLWRALALGKCIVHV